MQKKNKAANFSYKVEDEKIHTVEETVSPYYQRGGVGYALALLGLSEPDSVPDTFSEYDLVSVVRKGLSKNTMDKMMDTMDVTAQEMSKILRISDRTLRRYSADSILDTDQSERLVDLARLYSRGADVFGSISRFRRWMASPIISLGGERPIDLTDTSIGLQMIHDTLGRIEYGIVG